MNLVTCVIETAKPPQRKINWFRYYYCLRQRFDSPFLVASADTADISSLSEIPTRALDGWEEGGAYELDALTSEALNVLTFTKELPPRGDGNTYPRHWRSLLACFELAKDLQCERLITLESDSWVLTPRLADRLRNQTSGIGCPWCPIHEMPELMLAVYHQDIFDRMIEFIKSKTWEEWAQPQPENLERTLGKVFGIKPWMDLVGDRYCEREAPEQTPPADCDFVIQGETFTPKFRA